MKIVAILSSTLISGERAMYNYEPLTEPPDVKDIPHYVGHPDTKAILDEAGAKHQPGLFAGLKEGESFIAVQLKVSRKPGEAFTTDQKASLTDLKWGVVTRVGILEMLENIKQLKGYSELLERIVDMNDSVKELVEELKQGKNKLP